MLLTTEAVRFSGFSTALCRILSLLEELDRQKTIAGQPANLIITAGSNGQHKPGSSHYFPRFSGLDIRTRDPQGGVTSSFTSDGAKHAFVALLTNRLGPRFLVLFEDINGPNEHVHIQLRKGATYW